MRYRAWLVIAAGLAAGCTHTHLRHNAVKQAETVTDLQQQQVLNNVAMFCVNPDALPYFSVPGGGTTAVNDTVGGSAKFDYSRIMFTGWSFTAGGISRGMNDNWSLGPINDPDKLERMRCAYQIAVGQRTRGLPCSDCCALERQWQGNPKDFVCPECCRTPGPGWYGVGCKRDVPQEASYVGNYGKTYVWVLPDGIDSLTRLTLTILDYATLKAQTAPAVPSQSVVRTWKSIYNKPEDDPTRRIISYELVETKVTTTEAVGAPAYTGEPQLPATNDAVLDAEEEVAKAKQIDDPRAEARAMQRLHSAKRAAAAELVPEILPVRPTPPLRERENFYEPLRGLINLP